MEEVTDGARALNLCGATVRETAEEKAEVPSSNEVEAVETKLKELRQAYENTLEEYRSHPKRGLLEKKESLDEIAKGLALLHIDCHFLQDISRRERVGEAVSAFHGEVYGAIVRVEDAIRRVLHVQLDTEDDKINLWMENPNLGREIDPADLKRGMVV